MSGVPGKRSASSPLRESQRPKRRDLGGLGERQGLRTGQEASGRNTTGNRGGSSQGHNVAMEPVAPVAPVAQAEHQDLPRDGPSVVRSPDGDRYVVRKDGVVKVSLPVASLLGSLGWEFDRALRSGNFEGIETIVSNDPLDGVEAARRALGAGQEYRALIMGIRSCGGCSSGTHTLEDCIQANEEGRVQGCPVCNTTDHSLDNCARFSMYPEKRKLDVLVGWRGNKPPFATNMSWFEMLQRGISENRVGVPEHLPWTPAFAKHQANNLSRLQFELDTHKDEGRMPKDLTTKDWAHACANHGVYGPDEYRGSQS